MRKPAIRYGNEAGRTTFKKSLFLIAEDQPSIYQDLGRLLRTDISVEQNRKEDAHEDDQNARCIADTLPS